MYKLSYNANGLRNMEVTQAIREVAAAGYDGIELSFHPVLFDPLNRNEKQLYAIGKTLRDCGLELPAISCGCAELLGEEPYEPSLIHPDAGKRQRRMELMKSCMDIAQALRCRTLIFASGFRKEGISGETAMAVLVREIRELLAYNREVDLAVEPEPGMFIGTTDEAIRLIKAADSERLRMNLDLGHVKCCEENYLDKIEAALPYAVHCHIEDIAGRVHRHLLPGDGDMDFAKLHTILIRGYQGHVSVELYHHNDVWRQALAESFRYLSGLGTEGRRQ